MPFTTTEPFFELTRHTGPVVYVVGIPDTTNPGLVLSAGKDGLLCVWDVFRGRLLRTASRDGIYGAVFTCATIRFDVPEVLVGTEKGDFLRCPLIVEDRSAYGRGRIGRIGGRSSSSAAAASARGRKGG